MPINRRRTRSSRTPLSLAVLAAVALGLSAGAHADGDVQDQFYRHVEIKNKTFEAHLPGETVDHFTGTLRIVQEDLFLPGKGGLDLRIVRAYSSRIWGRADGIDAEPLLAEKDPSPLGYGWSIHMGRLQRPFATGQPTACGGGDYPVYEAPDGTARTFYPLPGGFTRFVSRDSWKLDTQCTTQRGPGACITTTTGDRLEFAKAEQYDVGASAAWPLTAHLDVFGNAIEVAYQGGGRVQTITDTWSRTVEFAYSPCGPRQCLDSITASGPGGSRQVTYGYTSHPVSHASGSRAFLTSVQPPAGPGYVYDYGAGLSLARNRYGLSSITYPHGGTTAYTYDARMFFTGREDVPMSVVVRRTTSGRELPTATWTYEYDAPRTSDFQTTTVVRPDQLQDVFQFVGFGFPARMNATGNVWKVGLQTRASYANAAHVEESTWDKGTVVATANFAAPFYGMACPGWLWDTVVQSPVLKKRVTTRGGSRYELETSGHDAFGQPDTVTETGEAQRTSNRPVRVTQYKYDYDLASNQVIARVSNERACQGTGTSDCMETARTFAGLHRRLDSERSKGVTTRYRYHPDGDVDEITNALGQTLTLSAYDNGIPTRLDFNGAYTIDRSTYWDGSLRSESNGRGHATTYTYDAAGRIETSTPPGGNDASTYAWDPAGASYSVTRGSGAGSFVETTVLDGLGRVIESNTSLGRRQTREYDGMGRLVFSSYAFGAGQPEVGDRFELDGLGRPTATHRRFVAIGHRPLTGGCAEPSACKVAVAYLADHCRSTTVDRASNDRTTTRACFESFADPSEERLRVLTDAASKIWSYAYDVDGNLKTFNAPKSAGNRSLTYAPGTFFTTSENSGPRGRTEVTDHDDMGHPLEQRDAAGARTIFEYNDPLARPTLTQYGPGSDDDVKRGYDRDVLDNVSSVGGGSYEYGYDELGRTTSQRWDFGGVTYKTAWDYDDAGCLETLTYPTGTVATMECDAQGRPVKVDRVAAGTTESIAQDVVYHAMGRVESMKFGNGLAVATGVVNGRVASIRTPGVMDLSFAYDGADNITKITDAVLPANTLSTITYDKLDRISDVTTTMGIARYRYDDLGNRTERTFPGEGTTSYHYDPATNRLSWSAGSGALPVGTLSWTPAERIRETSDGAIYWYDGLGRRVAKQLSAEMIDIVYHYDVSGRLLAETKPDGTPVREYFYAADQLVAVHGCPTINMSGCNVTQWYHADHLGSVRARTDVGGAVVASVAYQPWGETPASAKGPALFNSRPQDTGLGLYDLGARSYAPKIGRFVSADTVWSRANPQGANAYAYVLNNPLKHTDPDGHVPWVVISGGIGAVVGGAIAAYEFRHLQGAEFAKEVAWGMASGALAGASLSVRGPAGALMALSGGAAKAYQSLSSDAPRGPTNELSTDFDSKVFSREVRGAGTPTRSSAPDGGVPVKGVQGGKPLSPSPLSKTPDAGQPAQKQAPAPQKGNAADAGVNNDDVRFRFPKMMAPNAELIP
jgi:RHS repeat-associated protein